jgi:hypothetical protein
MASTPKPKAHFPSHSAGKNMQHQIWFQKRGHSLKHYLTLLAVLAFSASAFAQEQPTKAEQDINAKILWCEGQPYNAPVDAVVGTDEVQLGSCGRLLRWVDQPTQEAGLGERFLRKAAQTDPGAKKRLDAWEVEKARRKEAHSVPPNVLKQHDATTRMLHLGMPIPQVKSILITHGFDSPPWECSRDNNGADNQTLVTCVARRHTRVEYNFIFVLSRRFWDPDTQQAVNVSVNKLTFIKDWAEDWLKPLRELGPSTCQTCEP